MYWKSENDKVIRYLNGESKVIKWGKVISWIIGTVTTISIMLLFLASIAYGFVKFTNWYLS